MCVNLEVVDIFLRDARAESTTGSVNCKQIPPPFWPTSYLFKMAATDLVRAIEGYIAPARLD